MTTPDPSFAAISRVVLQPGSVRITVSVFCFKSAINASCFSGLTFSRLIRMTDSSDIAGLLLFGHTKDDPRDGNGSRRRRFLKITPPIDGSGTLSPNPLNPRQYRPANNLE